MRIHKRKEKELRMARRIAERINDTSVQSWVEGRKLATIKEYWEEQNKQVESMAELVREVVNDYLEVVIRRGARPIESLEEAREILRVWGRTPQSWLGRGRAEGSAMRNMREESIRDTRGQMEQERTREIDPRWIKAVKEYENYNAEPRRNPEEIGKSYEKIQKVERTEEDEEADRKWQEKRVEELRITEEYKRQKGIEEEARKQQIARAKKEAREFNINKAMEMPGVLPRDRSGELPDVDGSLSQEAQLEQLRKRSEEKLEEEE